MDQTSSDNDLWTVLGKPIFIAAPMVDQSELAFRLLCRKYGAQLCYTPMLHAGIFVKDPKYRKENFVSCDQDRPLIVQFCSNNPETFLQASKIAAPYCDAVDLNLGCPQTIAKRGHYGAFLEDEWSLLHNMVKKVSTELNIPVTCKIRVFSDIEKTIKYAKMLEGAGCKLLTVHARTKEQKGVFTGLADWDKIRIIKEHVNIPVIANGNIQSLSDVFECLRQTNANGVMSAEGILYNPALFKGINPPAWKIAEEYVSLVDKFPCALSMVRGHLFKFHHTCLSIEENCDLRRLLAKASGMDHIREFVKRVKERYISEDFEPILINTLPAPPILCQPHFRPTVIKKPEIDGGSEKKRRKAKLENVSQPTTRVSTNVEAEPDKSLKSVKKQSKRKLPLCSRCPNPKGAKCDFNLCRACCRQRASEMVLNCIGHKFLLKTKKMKRKDNAEGEEENGVKPVLQFGGQVLELN